MAGLRQTPKTIDQIAAKAEQEWQQRIIDEAKRRNELAKRLGERAAGGEPVGVEGFMLIGFPELTPDSEKYQRIIKAFHSVSELPAGTFVEIGQNPNGVIGVKADDSEGIAFRIDRQVDGGYQARADLLCARALYRHSLPGEAKMHGNNGEPYGVTFIDNSLGNHATPVYRITLASNTNDGCDEYRSGTPSWTDAYTQRILAELTPAA